LTEGMSHFRAIHRVEVRMLPPSLDDWVATKATQDVLSHNL
jgi:hypothetical protein